MSYGIFIYLSYEYEYEYVWIELCVCVGFFLFCSQNHCPIISHPDKCTDEALRKLDLLSKQMKKET